MSTSRKSAAIAAALLAALAVLAAPLAAQSVVIGMQAEPQAIDPHFSTSGPTQRIADCLFERLFMPDDKKLAGPALALSWKRIDELSIEVKLRPNVKFSDGSPLTADDVLFSFERVPTVPNSPASYIKDVTDISVKVVDPLTLRFTSKKPNASLLGQISRIFIVSRKAATGATSNDFNSGKAALGAGPYKFVEWLPGDRIVLARNELYYGKKPYAQKATIRIITNDSARVAALLAGDVDLIDTVPPTDIASLRADPKVSLWPIQGSTIIYIHMDSDREKTPFVTDKNGKAFDKNPLKDKRVRMALSLLMDRKLLVDRVLQGSGTPAIQMVPPGYLGYIDNEKAPAVDVAKAKKLLAEAGYPNGFALTLHSANDRYSFQPEVVQAVAQFLARGGIEVKVETMPTAVFLPKATNTEYSFFLLGFGNSTGEGTGVLSAVLGSYNKEKNLGSNNRGRYSSASFDDFISKAMAELDDDKRDVLLQAAAKVAIDDAAVIPLYIETTVFATKKSFVFKPGLGIPRPEPMDLYPAAK